jgi:hypothetical protein
MLAPADETDGVVKAESLKRPLFDLEPVPIVDPFQTGRQFTPPLGNFLEHICCALDGH